MARLHRGAAPTGNADHLLDLVRTDPVAAEAAARHRLVTGGTDAAERARLWWVVGLARREAGALDEARAAMRDGAEQAERAGDRRLWAQITASLALVLGQLGDLDTAADLLRAAEPHAVGVDRVGVLGQLGLVLYWRGDLAEATAFLARCCAGYAEHGEEALEARFRGNLGAVLSVRGDLAGAERELTRSAELAGRLGMGVEAGMAWANLGYVATLRGDLPSALAAFAEGESQYLRAAAHSLLPRLYADHAQALADAGLFTDAQVLVDQAIGMFRAQGQRTELAGALLTASEIQLVEGRPGDATRSATEAEQMFVDQGRASWAAAAHGLALQAAARGAAAGGAAGRLDLAAALDDSAARLAAAGRRREALRGHLTAGHLRAEAGAGAGKGVEAGADATVPDKVRRAVARGPVADRILLARIDARRAINRGDRAAARRSITRGLAVATANQAGLGSIETRAHAAVHGHELVELGARLAIGDRRPRELLARVEATRVIASRLPSARPPADPEMAALLAELRGHELALADPTASVTQRRQAEEGRRRVERQVRRRSRTARGDGTTVDLDHEIAGALGLLGPRHLLAYATVDRHLYAVSVIGGRARLHDLAPLAGVRERIEGVAFAISRLSRAQGSAASRLAAAEMLFGLADELAGLLLPAPVADASAPVVVVPTAVLHDVPWGLLPPLAGRAVSVSASLTAWGRAARARRERPTPAGGHRAVLVAGPGLEFAELEVAALAPLYPGSTVLAGSEATGERWLDAFASSDVAHVACHGAFRTDNPLFSSIHLADGPLNVYDFERLGRLPGTVVLSACSVAGTKALQGGPVLGLATALTTLGASSVVAPLTPISDASSVTVMQRIHGLLAGGASAAEALAGATMTQDLTDPTAAAFVALGA